MVLNKRACACLGFCSPSYVKIITFELKVPLLLQSIHISNISENKIKNKDLKS